MNNKNPKILYFDVETSLIKVKFNTFQLKLYNNYLPYTAIEQDYHIICASWRWIGEKTIHSASVLDNGNKDLTNDKYVVDELRKAVEAADIVVYHNGDHFDLKKLKSRIIFHRLKPLPNRIVSVDTYKAAKKEFNFTSNRLDYLGHHFKVGQKLDTPPGLWERALAGDRAAIKAMVKYNKGDIVLGEAVYQAMKPYIRHPDLNVIKTGKASEEICGTCGKKSLQAQGTRVAVSRLYQRLKCTSCGHWQQKEILIKADKNE